ncbi:MAG: MmgE/PrpD family protein, partial [Clostridiaceae bacterium]|nr:MmgE/PrpD family protein [Clostridiaceae bacterium]
MDKVDASIKFAHRAVETKYEDLSERDVNIAKLSFLDTIGVILAASTLGDKCIGIVEDLKEQGGKKEASVLAFGGKLPAPLAAEANGAMAHALDYDDATGRGGVHPSGATVPTSIALMEKYGILNGKDLITAIVVGNDLNLRLGLASPSMNKVYATFAPLTLAIYAAAIAGGKILGLTKDQMVNCLGIAHFQACGSARIMIEGDCDQRELYQYFAAQAGVLSAEWAKKGIRGIKQCFESHGGLYDIFAKGDYDPSYLDINPDNPFLMDEICF